MSHCTTISYTIYVKRSKLLQLSHTEIILFSRQTNSTNEYRANAQLFGIDSLLRMR